MVGWFHYSLILVSPGLESEIRLLKSAEKTSFPDGKKVIAWEGEGVTFEDCVDVSLLLKGKAQGLVHISFLSAIAFNLV